MMKEEINETKGFFERLSDEIHYFIKGIAPDSIVLFGQVTAKLLFLILIIISVNFIFNLIIKGLHSIFEKKVQESLVARALYDSKVLFSISNFVALGFGQQLISPIMDRHPNSHELLARLFSVLMIVAGYILYKRILNSVERYYVLQNDFYRITAIRAITQSLRIIGIFLFSFLAISNVFGVSKATIWGSLTAMTAVILLVFRDTILGFITGFHVSTSKNLKVGDWVGISKYNIEGNIQDINLLTTKIQNFDKTISTIPTYDLLSTEIRNLQVMAEGNKRRIKKSILFNITSFKFIDDELFERLKKVNLIAQYLDERFSEINQQRTELKNSEFIINGKQLTNIGVFRKYVLNFLKQNQDVDQEEVMIVRQLEITSQGLPLEIYCFAKKTALQDFEEIQADIFDHLLASAKIFDLEIMQVKTFN